MEMSRLLRCNERTLAKTGMGQPLSFAPGFLKLQRKSVGPTIPDVSDADRRNGAQCQELPSDVTSPARSFCNIAMLQFGPESKGRCAMGLHKAKTRVLAASLEPA
jgi:hypothetical protein